jgi:amidase
LPDPVPDYLAGSDVGASGLRIGIDVAWNEVDVDHQTRRTLGDAARIFAALGAQLVEIHFPAVEQIVADWSFNCAVEAAVAHEQTYPARADEYGPVLASVIEAGRAFSGIDYQKILLRRMAFRGQVQALFEGIDVLLTPVQPVPPLSLETIRTLGEQPDLIAKLQRYTCPFDASGHPTITLPGGFSDEGMPIGFQLVAAHLGEAVLVRAGAAYQRATEWHRQRPAV